MNSGAIDRDGVRNHFVRLMRQWEEWASRGVLPPDQRQWIAASWRRCKRLGVDLYREEAPVRLGGRDVAELSDLYRGLIDAASPYMEHVHRKLGPDRVVVALGDGEGLLLQVLVDAHHLRKHVDRRHFFGGADWSEAATGTNAVGTAAVEGRAVQVMGPEHFCTGWHEWICSAVPIREPVTGTVLGVLDVTSRLKWYRCHDMALLQSAADRIARELQGNALSTDFLWKELAELTDKPVFVLDRNRQVVRSNASAVRWGFCTGGALPLLEGPEAPLRGEDKPGAAHEYRLVDRNILLVLKIFPYKLWGCVMGAVCIVADVRPPRADVSRRRGGWAALYDLDGIIGESSVMREAKALAKKAAGVSAPLFLAGETGTGKELFAHAVHAAGPRAGGPFVTVNCGALQRELAASELFGYEEGAFTGAKKRGQPGKLVLADGGTVFLDEVGDLPPDCQTLLLRFLEEGRVVPVGGSRPVEVDVRIIAATHKNLREEVRAGRFREDLFYRLSAVWIRIPPLRERKEDIPLLAVDFLRRFAEQMNKPAPVLSGEALEKLMDHSWPGNVRELRNVIQRAVFFCDGPRIEEWDIRLGGPFEEEEPGAGPTRRPVHLDRQAVEEALRETRGNVSRAAEKLGISRITLYRKMKAFQLR